MKRDSFLKRLLGAGAGLALMPSLIKGEGVSTPVAKEIVAPAAELNLKGLELIPIPNGFEQVEQSFDYKGRKVLCSQGKISLKVMGSDATKEIQKEEFKEKLKKTLRFLGYTHIHAIFLSPTIYHPINFEPSKCIYVVGYIDQTPTS